MNLRPILVFCAMVVSSVVAAASATTFVQYRQGTSGPWTTLYNNYTWNISQNPVLPIDLGQIGGTGGLPFGTWYFRVWNSSVTEDLGHIHFINDSASRSVVLIIASLSDPNADVLNPSLAFQPGCRDFGGTQLSGPGTLTTQISIVRYDVLYNQIRADRLVRLDVGGSISDGVAQVDNGQTHAAMGPVFCGTLNSSVSATRGTVTSVQVAGNVETGGTIQASDTVASTGGIGSVVVGGSLGGLVRSANGSIGSIVVGGDVTARIHAENGAIGDVTIHGSLMSPDEFGTGNFPIRSRNGINKLTATSVNANITAAIGGGTGKIGLFKTTNGAMLKTLIFKELSAPTGTGSEAGIIINGDLANNALIRFYPGGAHTEKIRIKGSLAGEIRFDDAADLDTQIVLNAGNNGGTWANTGKVVLGPAGSQTVLSTLASPSDNQGPHYRLESSILGGGAVGLVPYRLYANDCAPKHHDDWVVPSGEAKLLDSQFNGGTSEIPITKIPVRMKFYGPVKTDAAVGTSPVNVWLWVADSGGVYQQWHEVTDALNITVARGTDPWSREIVITPTATFGALPPGYYAVTAQREGTNRLYCEGTLASTPPAVDWNISATNGTITTYYTQYNFQLFSDCDNNGVWDATQIAADSSLDMNGDGYLDACSGAGDHCPADLDNGELGGVPDGAVEISDMLYFLAGFYAGSSVVDLDNDGDPSVGTPDGAVTIDDLLFFVAHFEGGC
jgi:hypothetical protein